ncbi:MAG: hypothetical protein AVDCRST_MAG17-1033 [uncultured Solirubrobacterales bacterium]|uniref:Uncharacterized protein n=1 Tax=uncultured Solirubrobacterales bacterium TaxID=768556 RepID=A0A6J4SDX1_9ACTN|nr:MAG: hypothetical protein AVDCRST_MAG17-1033 [uncultured Solirubrobacterales bacterium]
MAGELNDLLRASDAERERAVDLLRAAGAEGRLTVDELEERTVRALRARTHGELKPLTRDLPHPPPRRQPGPPPRRRAPSPHQLAAYLAVNLILIAIWALTGADYFWPIWPLLGWGIGLFAPHRSLCGGSGHAGAPFGRGPS